MNIKEKPDFIQLNLLKIFLFSFLSFFPVKNFTLHALAQSISNPCAGPTALLSIINRPTVGDSPCVVPYHNAVLELGYQHQKLLDRGQQQNFPEPEFRIGLPASNELVLLLPNYIHQTVSPISGSAASVIGIKHELGYNEHWISTVESLFTLHSGSDSFGSDGIGAAFNGVFSYKLNERYNLTLMLGETTQTTPSALGGKRFESFNPDLVFSWTPGAKLSFYGEIYGQSKTGPGQEDGFNCDGGLIYLLFEKFAIDLEYGQRINGLLGGFRHYIGTGASMMI